MAHGIKVSAKRQLTLNDPVISSAKPTAKIIDAVMALAMMRGFRWTGPIARIENHKPQRRAIPPIRGTAPRCTFWIDSFGPELHITWWRALAIITNMIATLTNQPFKNTPIDSNSNKVHLSFQKQLNDCRLNCRTIDLFFKLTKDSKPV